MPSIMDPSDVPTVRSGSSFGSFERKRGIPPFIVMHSDVRMGEVPGMSCENVCSASLCSGRMLPSSPSVYIWWQRLLLSGIFHFPSPP